MPSKHICILTTTESRQIFGSSKLHISPPLAKAKVLVLFHCFIMLLGLHCLWVFVFCPCFIMSYFLFLPVLQLS